MAQPGEATEWYSTSVPKQTVTVQRRASTQGQARESTKRQQDRKPGRSRGTEGERKRESTAGESVPSHTAPADVRRSYDSREKWTTDAQQPLFTRSFSSSPEFAT